MVDAAYKLPSTTNLRIPSRKSTFRIGLSVHAWSGITNDILTTINKALTLVSQQMDIEVLLIPHILTIDNTTSDSSFMRHLCNLSDNKYRIISIPDELILRSHPEPAYSIKKLTQSVDVLVSSRYHGLVFALSSNIPCITFTLDQYYDQKNINLLKSFYSSANEYILPTTNPHLLTKQLISLLNSLTQTKYLSRVNLRLSKKFTIVYPEQAYE